MIKVSAPAVGSEELEALRLGLEEGYFGHGRLVLAFEQALQEYLGAPQVVAVSSGTAALHLALVALGIGPGDEVMVPSLTFVACFQAIAATGALPVPCDVQPDTLLMDLEDVEGKLSPATRILMPVHYAGNPCDLEAIYALAESRGLRVIEDAAHALGSTYQGRKIGAAGDVVCFSFDSIKNITCGEGGAIICRDPALAERLRRMRLLGITRPAAGDLGEIKRWVYAVQEPGFRYHMSNLNAALGQVQLGKLPGFIAQRQRLARFYDEALADLDSVRPLKIDYTAVAPHIYVIRVTDGRRDELMDFLRERGIEASINYIPNHHHERFRALYVGKTWSLPVTEQVFGEILTLPLHCRLTQSDVETVIENVRQFFRND